MINVKFRVSLTVLAAASLIAACTTLRVKSDLNTAVNTQCHSFMWAGAFHPKSGELRDVANPVNESRLRAAIQSNLAARGVMLVEPPGQAECIVGYGIGVHNVVEGAYPYGWGWGGGWGGRRGYIGGAWWDGPYVFQEGVIAVDLYDARGRVPIWHAAVDQNVQGMTGASAEAKINAAVTALFTKYPGVPVAAR